MHILAVCTWASPEAMQERGPSCREAFLPGCLARYRRNRAGTAPKKRDAPSGRTRRIAGKSVSLI
ncbi:hypothetical protein [uncultured Phocaeicola sp.]|uniref:hypothetical protein n=1 Tax=uncultured Phocaeicola sp. TaxID=990718 RepID=UPI0025E4A0F8|nr:hypothetical protein [uncultured Phocaeicola sp.]